jgi:protein TonB
MLNRERPANPEPHRPLFVSVALALGSPIIPEIGAPAPPEASQPARAESPLPKADEPAVAIESAPAAPVDAPASIQPEIAAPPAGPTGSAVGTPDGGERAATGTEGAGSGAGKGSSEGSGGPVRLGAGIQPPKKVKDVKAVYPPEALASQLRGTVVVEATISADGRVVDAVVRRSIPGLDQAALDAVRQWEYEPARMNGAPIAVIMTVTVAFAIL